MNGERKLAMFIDFENIARGVKEAQYKQFELKLVLERLLEKGKIIVRRAYADWNRFTEYKRPFHEWAIEARRLEHESGTLRSAYFARTIRSAHLGRLEAGQRLIAARIHAVVVREV